LADVGARLAGLQFDVLEEEGFKLVGLLLRVTHIFVRDRYYNMDGVFQ
jgi:hypothetical protein